MVVHMSIQLISIESNGSVWVAMKSGARLRCSFRKAEFLTKNENALEMMHNDMNYRSDSMADCCDVVLEAETIEELNALKYTIPWLFI